MSTQVTSQSRVQPRQVAEHVATVLSAVLETELVVREADDGGEADWMFEARDAADPSRRVAAALASADATAIATRLRKDAGEGEETERVLSEVWAALIDRLRADAPAGWTGTVAPIGETRTPWAAAYRLEDDEGFAITLLVDAKTDAPRDAAAPEHAGRLSSQSGVPPNLDVILDIDLPLTVRFGGTDMTIDALSRLGPGTLIDLGRSPDDPVEVLVNGRMVARGEVVVVGGNYGVRVTEVVSAADRLRSMGM